MEFRIWVEIRLTGRILERQLVAQVERAGAGPEEIGLILEEGKSVLHQVQACMIQRQVEVLQAAHWRCVHCGRKQRIKDQRTRCVRTVFGRSSIVPTLYPLPVSGWEENHCLAASSEATARYNSGASVSLR